MSEGIVLKISDRFRDRKVEFFNDFQINLIHNSIGSTFSFNFYFDPFNEEHKEFAAPHYHTVTLEFNGEPFFRGTITNQKFRRSSKKQLASIGGYSITGVLQDSQIPTEIYPLQSVGISLASICRKVLRPFDIGLVIDDNVLAKANKVIPKTTSNNTQTVQDYLSTIAKQQNIILTSDEVGNLRLTESLTNQEPILEFDFTKEVIIPGTDFELNYNGQGMHSTVTTMRQASSKRGSNSGQQTLRNPLVIGSVVRPKVSSQSSGDDNDTRSAVKRELANDIKGVTLTITTDRWVVDGKILRPNNLIAIYDPELFLYRRTLWFIESISFTGDNIKTIATINCVLPEVYNNETPVNIFRGINLRE